MKTQYICTEDLQGGSFGVGRVGDINYWRETALEWNQDDWDEEGDEFLRTVPDGQLLSLIEILWDIKIEEKW